MPYRAIQLIFIRIAPLSAPVTDESPAKKIALDDHRFEKASLVLKLRPIAYKSEKTIKTGAFTRFSDYRLAKRK